MCAYISTAHIYSGGWFEETGREVEEKRAGGETLNQTSSISCGGSSYEKVEKIKNNFHPLSERRDINLIIIIITHILVRCAISLLGGI